MLRVARSIQLATRNWGMIGNANHETDVNTAGFTKLNYLQNSVLRRTQSVLRLAVWQNLWSHKTPATTTAGDVNDAHYDAAL